MLLYELFLKHKDETETNPGESVPCKKIYAKCDGANYDILIDEKTITEYGVKDEKTIKEYGVKDNVAEFQSILDMPFFNLKSVGLPDRRTGSNSKPPYIIISGQINGTKINMKIQGHSNTKKKDSMSYEYDFIGTKIKKIVNNDIVIRLDETHYLFEGKRLYDEYIQHGLITPPSTFNSTLFIKVAESFIGYCNSKKLVNILQKNSKKFPFKIVILPMSMSKSVSPVRFHEESDSLKNKPERLDAFEFPMFSYANGPVLDKSSKFVSYDDRAFTINCNREDTFYEILGIGDQSIEKIKMPPEFNISGLNWYFMSFSESEPTPFERKNTGIYDQLQNIYAKLIKDKKGSIPEKSKLKIICTKKSQAKVEILLDENVTIDQLAKNFKFNMPKNNHSAMAFEILIEKNDKGEIIDWSKYIFAIRSTLVGVRVDRFFILSLLQKQIRKYLFNWIEVLKKDLYFNDAIDFFRKSDFCLEIIVDNPEASSMVQGEMYAYKIGQIAGEYLKYKRKVGETSNSMYDIMTYTKYDRERLRFVFKRVIQGLLLSNKYESEGKIYEKKIADITPTEEIDDASAELDYSYFFYKGLFEKLKGEHIEPRI